MKGNIAQHKVLKNKEGWLSEKQRINFISKYVDVSKLITVTDGV